MVVYDKAIKFEVVGRTYRREKEKDVTEALHIPVNTMYGWRGQLKKDRKHKMNVKKICLKKQVRLSLKLYFGKMLTEMYIDPSQEKLL